MNSHQRRVARRKWCRDNATEIERVVTWVGSNPVFTLSSRNSGDDIIDMEEDKLTAFESEPYSYPRSRAGWLKFLNEKGVHVSISETKKMRTESVVTCQ